MLGCRGPGEGGRVGVCGWIGPAVGSEFDEVCGGVGRLLWWKIGLYRRSSAMVCCGGGGCTGMNLRRNFLFRMVILPEPSTRTTYWSNWRTSAVLKYGTL